MKLSEFKNHLQTMDQLTFVLPSGKAVPAHFHITEIGQLDKRFIDCGGTVRSEQTISMQLWTSVDIWHRLDAVKTLRIVDMAIEQLQIGDHSIEIEFQGESIEKYNLRFDDGVFHLTSMQTACLANDACGVPSVALIKESVKSCCTPGSGCC